MTILALRILPALAIARLGSADTPVDAYRLEEDSGRPLNFRHITPMRTFHVADTGEICKDEIPSSIKFKEAGRIRPVAPFFDVFAVTEGDVRLVRLDENLLKQNGATPADISWTVSVANRKVFRRTGNANDIVHAGPIQFQITSLINSTAFARTSSTAAPSILGTFGISSPIIYIQRFD